MAARLDPDWIAEGASFADEFDEPIVEWTLDELDRSADLGSLRSAWAAGDDHNE
jgi:hypothetical protein